MYYIFILIYLLIFLFFLKNKNNMEFFCPLIKCKKNEITCIDYKKSNIGCIKKKNIKTSFKKRYKNCRSNNCNFEDKISKKKGEEKSFLCPNNYKDCLSIKYMNKCGWCFSNTSQNKCIPGNKHGPFNKKKCINGWKYLTYPEKNTKEWSVKNLLNNNNYAPVIKCAYGPACNTINYYKKYI